MMRRPSYSTLASPTSGRSCASASSSRLKGIRLRSWSSRSRSARSCAHRRPVRCLPPCPSVAGCRRSSVPGSPGFPRQTRQLLLLMALDGTGDVRVLGAGARPNAGIADLAAAEQSRLAYLDTASNRLAFHHPLVRSAVVDLSQAEERRTAHRVLADLWAAQPERQAWHLAEASLEPDESVAAQLEATAGLILARGDAVGCVNALTRSSELSPAERRSAAASGSGRLHRRRCRRGPEQCVERAGSASSGGCGARGIPPGSGRRVGVPAAGRR